MKSLPVAAAALALALLTFFQFPGHTWLQQDSQIYLPILEHLRDPSVLQNDILVQHPHVGFTLYDEVARFLRAGTGFDFHAVLVFQQILTRAFGIWGLYLLGLALTKSPPHGWMIAAIVSLGAMIPGPQVLTFEYEPTPRAFALPLLFCALGLAAHGRNMAASIAASIAFLYHPPTTIPFWIVLVVILAWRHEARPAIPLAAAFALLLIASHGEAQPLFAGLDAFQEQLQRLRASYVWVSMWTAWQRLEGIIFAVIIAAACARLWRELSLEVRILLVGLSAIGLLSMPASWLFLEHWKWALVPQVQPLRALLFVTIAMQLLTCAAAIFAARRGAYWEAAAWFACAFYPPLEGGRYWLAAILGLVAAQALRPFRVPRSALAYAAPLAAFFVIPTLGGVTNYPRLHTPELSALSSWARASTPRDSVFLFADVGRGLEPGIFRGEALRAVYVDWKGGGQVNYLRDFAERWWFRWQQVMSPRFRASAVPKYEALGITYIVLQPKNRLPRPADFENGRYLAYALRQTPSPALQSK